MTIQKSPACEMLIGMYAEMVSASGIASEHIQQIRAMVLESETLDKWPVEYRDRLMKLFEDALATTPPSRLN